jgi:hypothetical protein
MSAALCFFCWTRSFAVVVGAGYEVAQASGERGQEQGSFEDLVDAAGSSAPPGHGQGELFSVHDVTSCTMQLA